MTQPTEQTHISALADLLDARGLNADDFIQVLDILGKVKKKEVSDIKKEEQGKIKQNKIFVDKEFVFEKSEDCFIYRDGRTKTGNFYIRIYDANTKKVYSQSLRTKYRENALVSAQVLYREKKDKLFKGKKMVSITTGEMIDMYLKKRGEELTEIPKMGITPLYYRSLKTQLNYWMRYITFLKLDKKYIEKIPTDIGKDFGFWISNLPKERYGDRKRSAEVMNGVIGAVKKMYQEIGINEDYIAITEIPKFKKMKVSPNKEPKRDVLDEAEYLELLDYMKNKYCRETGISEKERVKRRVFALYISLNYNVGCRVREMLNLRWCDISKNPNDTIEQQKLNRVITIHAEQSKTGKGRNIVSPIADKLARIENHYKKIGYIPKKTDYVFINLTPRGIEKNISYSHSSMDGRLKDVLEKSGMRERLEKDNRNITLYSGRHYYATARLMKGVDIYHLSLNLGTSVIYLEQTYSHLTTLMVSDEITKGQGWRANKTDKAERQEAYD
jgi:integrase